MADLATLSFAIDSRPLDEVSRKLEGIPGRAKAVEGAASSMSKTVNEAAKASDANANALNKATGAAQATATATSRAAITTGGLTKAMNDNAKAVGLNANQYKMLGFQINDVLTGLASGQQPLQILAQQGGQVYQVLQMGEGGVGGALKGIGRTLASLVTPGRLAFAGLSAGLGFAALSFSRFAESQREVEAGLRGLGRASGATVADINRIASAAAAASTLSVSAAREIATAFASSGKFGVAQIAELTSVVDDFATTTGATLEDARKNLIKAFADPAKGAEILDDQLNFLTASQKEYIRQLALTGNKEQARVELMRALKQNIEDAASAMPVLSRAWNNFWNNVDKGVNVVGQAVENVLSDALPKKLEHLLKSREALSAQQAFLSKEDRANSEREIEDLDARILRTEALLKAEQDRAGIIGEIKRAQDTTKEATDRARASFPDLGQYDKNVAAFSSAEGALKQNQDMGGLLLNAEQVAVLRAEIERTSKAILDANAAGGALNMTVTQGALARKLEIDAIRATTIEERARIAEIQTLNSLLGQSISQEEANARAIQAGNVIREQAAQATRSAIQEQEFQIRMLEAEQRAIGMTDEQRQVYLAGIREEIAILKEGGNLLDADSQKRIQNAQAIARQAAALEQSAAAARQEAAATRQATSAAMERAGVQGTPQTLYRAQDGRLYQGAGAAMQSNFDRELAMRPDPAPGTIANTWGFGVQPVANPLPSDLNKWLMGMGTHLGSGISTVGSTGAGYVDWYNNAQRAMQDGLLPLGGRLSGRQVSSPQSSNDNNDQSDYSPDEPKPGVNPRFDMYADKNASYFYNPMGGAFEESRESSWTQPIIDSLEETAHAEVMELRGIRAALSGHTFSGGSFSTAPGFLSGADFMVPGSGGRDRPYLMGLSGNERVQITPAGSNMGGVGAKGRGANGEQHLTFILGGGGQADTRLRTSAGEIQREVRRANRSSAGRR